MTSKSYLIQNIKRSIFILAACKFRLFPFSRFFSVSLLFRYILTMETIINKNPYNQLITVLGNIIDTTPRKCVPLDDKTTLLISSFLCVGLVVSYLPQVGTVVVIDLVSMLTVINQHYRIVANKTSEGFSAWFLLLGVVSSTSSFLNIILLQWDSIMCCKSLVSSNLCVYVCV
jgi:hypothetical protein